MNSGSEPDVTKQQLDDAITAGQIQKLIDERKSIGGDCKVVTENGKRFLVCVWAPL